MKALNLSIYTGSSEDSHKVTMTAEFQTHDDAVRFHEGVAKLCRDMSPPQPRFGVQASWPRAFSPRQLLGRH